MRTIFKELRYGEQVYGHENEYINDYKEYVYVPRGIQVVGRDFNFTRRIKYVTPKDRYGNPKDTIMYLEIAYTRNVLVKKRIWGEDVYEDRNYTLWVADYFFDFDFSDETIEEIVDCANF